MELSVSPLKELNEIIFNTIETSVENKSILEFTGIYLYKFFESEDSRINFKIPHYSVELKESIVDYVLIIEFIYKLYKIEKTTAFDDAVLFDIFQYLKDNKNSRSSNSYFRDFIKSVNDFVYFGNHTSAYTKRFLPLFHRENNSNLSKNNTIFQAFKYFAKISHSNIISFPVLINLKKDFSLYLSQKTLFPSNPLLADNVIAYEIEDTLESIIEKYDSFEIKNIISVKFPYNSNIDSRLQLIQSSKKIELTLNYRLSYDQIEPDDFVMLPNEFVYNDAIKVFSTVLTNYNVLNTSHTQELYIALKNLNDEWRSHNFNVYTTPYPAKWLMFIHNNENIDFWKSLYRNDFPAVPETICRKVDEIIGAIYSLNWIEKFFKKNAKGSIIFPKSKVLKTAIQSVKNYIANNFPEITVISSENEIQKTKKLELIVFDVFSIIPLSNLFQKYSDFRLIVAAPDFLYYNYQPHLKYHLVKYLFDPLVMGCRSRLDEKFETYKSIWSNNISTFLKQISKEKFDYQKRYNPEIVLAEIEETEIETFDIEIKEYSEAETLLQEHAKHKQFNNDEKSISITTVCGKNINLKSRQKILLKRRGFLVKSPADCLEEGNLFIPVDELNRSIDKEHISAKLSKMPLSGKEWQINLNGKNNMYSDLYGTLTKRGLSISRVRFEDKYLLKKRNGFELPTNFPKKKKDWNIIANCLDISDMELNQTWISYYGRKDLNKVKSMYIEILEEMISHNTFGQSENESFYENVIMSIKNCGFFETSLDFDYLELAKSITDALSSEIKLYEAQTLKIQA